MMPDTPKPTPTNDANKELANLLQNTVQSQDIKTPRRQPAVTLATLKLSIEEPNLFARTIVQINTLQRLLLSVIHCAETPVSELSGLVRAWDVLEERKRIVRGIPLPGQLRPDLDPVQLKRAIKRARSRNPIEIGNESKPYLTLPAEITTKAMNHTPESGGIIKGGADRNCQDKSASPELATDQTQSNQANRDPQSRTDHVQDTPKEL